MARMVVIYKTPADVASFGKHYYEVHVPIAKKIPGLRKYEVSRGPIATPAGPSDVYLVATLHFDDLAAIRKAFASAEGQAAGRIVVFSRPTIRACKCYCLTIANCDTTTCVVRGEATPAFSQDNLTSRERNYGVK
jgi:uncharacterized protein (TIGR02118 family)